MRLQKINPEKIICFLVIVYPILFRYRVIIPYITLGEAVLVVMLMVEYASKKKIYYLNCQGIRELALFELFIIINLFISILYRGASIDLIGSTMRLVLLYLLIILIIPIFDFNYAKHCLNVVATVVSIYGIIQVVFAHYGVYLTTSIPFLRPFVDENQNVLQWAMLGMRFRPLSVFNEPGEFGTYLALALYLNLFDIKYDNKSIFRSILLSITMIMTLSATGIAILIVEWFLFFIIERNTRRKYILLCICILGVIILGIKSDVIQFFIHRIFGGQGIESNTHFRDIHAVFDKRDITFPQYLFGMGVKDIAGFLPGVFRLLYYFGFIGAIIYVSFLFSSCKGINLVKQGFMIMWVTLNVAAAYMFGCFTLPYILFYLTLEHNYIGLENHH